MSKAWMPLYIGDYLGDTGHLSTVQHGAYLLLIMHYWEHGGLPDDDEKLARITRMRGRNWLAIRPTIAAFFEQPGWHHRRLNHELEVTSKRQLTQSLNAKKRWNNNRRPMPSHSHGNASTTTTTIKKETPSESPKKARARKTTTPFPQDWYPKAFSFTEQQMFEKMRDHCLAKGLRNVDWEAFARVWKRREPEFARNARTNGGTPRPGSREHRQEETYNALQQLRSFAQGYDEGTCGEDGDSPVGQLPFPKSA